MKNDFRKELKSYNYCNNNTMSQIRQSHRPFLCEVSVMLEIESIVPVSH